MVNAGEVSNRLDAHIEENNKRLQNLEVQMQDVQATLKAISDNLGIRPQPPPNITEQKFNTVKLEVAEFRGDQEPDVFLDWLHSVDNFFQWYNLAEDKKVVFIAAKLRGIARIWWEQYQRSGYHQVARWEDMRAALVRQFKPADYKQRASLQFTELVQGSKSVADYTRQFYSLAAQSEFPWDEDVLISMYRRGLNHDISGKVAGSRCFLLKDAIQIAHSVEDDLKRRSVGRSSFSSPLKNDYVFPDSNQGQQTVASKYNRAPISSQGSNTSRCFNCQGIGHKTFECPSPKQNNTLKRVNVVEKENDDDLYVEMTKEDLEAEEHLAKEANLGIMHATKDGANESHIRRQQIFHTRATCARKLCSLVIDTGSCTNVISKEAVHKLGLKVELHPEPYDITWIDDTKLRVRERCLVTFSVGRFSDAVMCDVLPLKLCDVILGRPWLVDRDAHHVARANTYTVVKNGRRHTLVCARFHMPFVQRSLVLSRAYSDFINSTESSSFQQRRIDAGQWVKKPKESIWEQYTRLWKPI